MRPHPALMTMRIIWFALLMATFIYMGIAYGVLPKRAAPPPPNPIMPALFGGVSLVVAVLSFLVPRMSYQQTAKSMNAKIAEEAAPSAFSARYREAMPKRAIFADPDSAVRQAFMSFQTPFILSIALSEAIALFGFVLAQLGFEMMMSLPFFVAGAVLIGIRFPQQATILAKFEQVYGASFPAQNG